MSPLLLFFFILFLAFAVIMLVTRPSRAEKMAQARLATAAGRPTAHVLEHVDILRHEAYSEIPWLNRLLAGMKPAYRLQKMINDSDLTWSVGKLVIGSIVAALLVGWIGRFWFQSTFVVAALAVFVLLAPYFYIFLQARRRLTKFAKLLPDAMDLVSRALRAGHSLTAALDLVAQEIPDPVGKEFRRVSEEQNLGLPLRDALLNLAERVPLDDVRFLVASMLIQRETGGNLVEVLDKTTNLLRERMKLQGQIRVFTAQGRMTGWILCLLPIIMFFALGAINPNYVSLLTGDPLGQKLLIAGACFMFLGIMVIRKIIRIKV